MFLLNNKVLFLVGGLGSSLYLSKFLQAKLKSVIEVKQPEEGLLPFQDLQLIDRYSAIMRGAVLHKLGLDYVKERIMRAHYGTSVSMPFRYGIDPPNLKYVNASGEERCNRVMEWLAHKVRVQLDFSDILGTKGCKWSCTPNISAFVSLGG